jgi:hypothetical protein
VIYCSHCGADNIDDGSFCVRCGSHLGHVADVRDESTSTAQSAGPPGDHGNGTDEYSPTSADTNRPAGRAGKRTRWAVLAVALLLVVGGSVTAGVMLHRHGRGPGSPAPGGATLHLTAAQSCTLKTLNVTKHLWETPSSNWTSEIAATQQRLLGRYGSGSRFLNAFNAAVSVGVQKAFLDGAVSAQIAEMVPVATACGSTHPQTWLGPAPKKKASPDFSDISALATDGSHLWVANWGGNSITELDPTNGSLVRTISGASYHFNAPDALAADGSHLWVANGGSNNGGNSLTELNLNNGSLVRNIPGDFGHPTIDGSHLWVTSGGNSITEFDSTNGSLVRTISGVSYHFNAPAALVADGSHLWVVNGGGNSITELDSNNGSLVRTISGASYDIHHPSFLAADGSHLWVANEGWGNANSITEINLNNGSLVRNIPGASHDFQGTDALVADGNHLWVATSFANVITELSSNNGSLVGTISAAPYDFDKPSALVADGSHLWVANSGTDPYGNSVTEINLYDGSLVRNISNAS